MNPEVALKVVQLLFPEAVSIVREHCNGVLIEKANGLTYDAIIEHGVIHWPVGCYRWPPRFEIETEDL